MRAEKVSERLLDACRVPYLEFPDQDALNQVCQGRVLQLSPVYNGIRTFFLPQYKSDFCKVYTEELWESVQRVGTIHYTGGKPWNIFTIKFGEWWKVFYSLPEDIRILMKVSFRIKYLSLLYKIGFGRFVDSAITIFRRVRYRRYVSH